MTSIRLTTSERLILPRIARDPTHGITAASLSCIVSLSPKSCRGLLQSLADKGFLAHSPNIRNRKYWRIQDSGPGTTCITPQRNIDDTLATLQAQAARANELEAALHEIANILVQVGIHIPLLETEPEESPHA